jgi:hypothetical protein
MSEKKTFDKLRRLPVQEVKDRISRGKNGIPPVFKLGSSVVQRKDFFDDIHFYIETINILEECGWNPQDFYLEMEKEILIDLINEYNASIDFPQEIIDRATRVFPNAIFKPARIEFQ